ncbi:hypothetical protein SAMN04487988_11813 [Algoriphagus hitonicola]|uniref:Uncharacterized protein n=1 Tax=Algoriphagus hitonicola TaxID=435880 RepID=A0A1I2XHG8_9BACT|nr:hypothetical protein SAMN04487988_11813 [Algoriphagus hitonicola]
MSIYVGKYPGFFKNTQYRVFFHPIQILNLKFNFFIYDYSNKYGDISYRKLPK